MHSLSILAPLGGALLGAALNGQPNVTPGLDGSVVQADSLTRYGTVGSTIGCGIRTTSCNPGTVNIEFFSASRTPMDNRHPFISFIVVRQEPGATRLVQISDRSFIKHAFASTNSGGCGSCRNPGTSSLLGVGCSDTYGSSLNASRRHLGPADEIDPWRGFWEPQCSYFDRGDPDVGPPGNCDNRKSLSGSGFDGIENRVQLRDADLGVSGARYFYGSYYVFPKEAEGKRVNNSLLRETRVSGGPGSWSFSNVGSPVNGTPLQFWQGASVTSNTNGTDDGRIYLASKVTSIGGGMWRYEYAMHNRDNHRGVAALRVPLCGRGTATNGGTRDIDQDNSNDWSVSQNSSEVAFLAGQDNALRWNMVYNFWFDADRPPTSGTVQVDAANPGPGASSFRIPATVPDFDANENLGAGCGVPSAPTLTATGSPARALIPNPSFGIRAAGMTPGNNVFINVGLRPDNLDLGNGCRVFTNPALTWLAASGVADVGGGFSLPVPVPDNVALEGKSLTFQAIEQQNGGAAFNTFDLSNGLRVHIGNGCQ